MFGTMEDQRHSPFLLTSYRCNSRHVSMKRARSPEISEGAVRPIKRLARISANSSPFGSTSGSRFPSEDWVQQAEDLSIDSPSGLPSSANGRRFAEDVDMALDDEPASTSRAQPLEASALLDQASGVRQDIYSLSTLPFRPSAPQHADLRAGVGPNGVPLINASSPAVMGNAVQEDARSPSIASMAISPPHSPIVPVRRMVFGPRANCEKCRMGVKAHFVHYD